jgi:DNA-binding transcriptional regulator of glucitol operon
VLRRVRVFLSPGWLALHLVALALVVTMVLLGRWQLDVSDAKHFNLQNFGYALQWWAFSAFVLVMWARIIRDHGGRGRSAIALAEAPASQDAEARTEAEPAVAYRRYVMPESASAPAIAADPEHAAYNDYLARLEADDASAKSRADGAAP